LTNFISHFFKPIWHLVCCIVNKLYASLTVVSVKNLSLSQRLVEINGLSVST